MIFKAIFQSFLGGVWAGAIKKVENLESLNSLKYPPLPLGTIVVEDGGEG